MDILVTSTLSIPSSEIQFRFARSGGRGGQHVNKVETKVEFLFDVGRSPCLSEAQRQLILQRLTSRLDSDGVLHIIVDESRSQWKNRELAIKRFVELLRKALKPKKKRIATKIPKAAKEKRLEGKKRRGEIKKMRKVNSQQVIE
ncbi:MAG TPA: alternative ribosome rescue aminoacyl-tRNA hydrolase ArfB [Bacteroidota bacterium]|nr:alternative ribosome rescue aminoacyl-tRNA hydrolase ArfB [Bacteroidota bacterium]